MRDYYHPSSEEKSGSYGLKGPNRLLGFKFQQAFLTSDLALMMMKMVRITCMLMGLNPMSGLLSLFPFLQ